MDVLWWILGGGLLMSCIALVGGVTLWLPEKVFKSLILPLVALSAGSLLGGAFFHLMPEAVADMGPGLAPWLWCITGFAGFFLLEQFLHWHHCHKPTSEHKEPLGWLILIADGVHNFVGGLAVAGAFLVDVRLGLVTWLAAAAHEIPQELGDFGILIHGGWTKKQALAYNFASGLTFLAGGLVAWAVSPHIDVTFLLPLGAGNFIYIAAADLIPEINRERSAKRAAVHFLSFIAGVAMLLGIHQLLPHEHGHHHQHEHGLQEDADHHHHHEDGDDDQHEHDGGE